jgi:hypothetical protein
MHKRGHRSTRRSTRRKVSQRGGGICAAMPLNREAFQQRGGMAPYSTGDATLLDKNTMMQAESFHQVADIDSAQVLAKQAGGARRRRSSRKHRKGSRVSRKHRKGSRKHRKGSRVAHRKGRRSTHRKQRGGSYPWSENVQGFDKPYTLVSAGTATGVNPQFHDEGSVNPMYSETRGAQY